MFPDRVTVPEPSVEETADMGTKSGKSADVTANSRLQFTVVDRSASGVITTGASYREGFFTLNHPCTPSHAPVRAITRLKANELIPNSLCQSAIAKRIPRAFRTSG